MGVTPPVTIRIGRVVFEEAAPGDAAATMAAFRGELARLAAAGKLPGQVQTTAHTLGAVTPAGRGRQAASRILGK